MQSVQESKQELEASIRYAENAISSAKQTIESMEFRQEMAKKQYSEQTGREQALEQEVVDLNKEVQRQQDLGQGYYDTMMTYKSQITLLEERIADTQSDMVGDASTIKTLKEEREMLEKNVKYLRDENERLNRDVKHYTKEYNKLVKQNEASSGPCGCQAYRDLEERVEFYKEAYTELEVAQGKGVPTMPVIPKAVAIAIFREGMQHGVEAACTELEGQTIEVEESEYYGHFEVSFSKSIELDEELDLDWMRGKVGDYSEDFVTGALGNLCADKGFECRIHGIDDQEEKKND